MSRRSLFNDVGDPEGFPRKSIDTQADLDITPMIDVVFLLLIFFMVTSTMQATPDVEVPPAQYGLGVEKENATVITVRKPESGGETGTIELRGGRTATLGDVRREIEEALQAGRTKAIVRADRETPHGFVQEVIRTVDSVEGIEFYIEVRDPKSR